MRSAVVRNLNDARAFVEQYEAASGVVADPTWVLSSGGRLVNARGTVLGGYVLDERRTLSASGVVPPQVAMCAGNCVELGAFWVRDGLPGSIRRKVFRRLAKDIRAAGWDQVVAVILDKAQAAVLTEVLPECLYEGPSAVPDVPWVQVRRGTVRMVKSGGLGTMWQRLVGSGQPALRTRATGT